MKKKETNIFFNVISFYLNGFKTMNNWGRQVWLIILIKLFIMFVVLKIFFFPNYLKSNFDTDKNGFFSKEEIKIIQKKAFSNLINYNYFIHIITHKKKIKFRNVSDFNVYKKEDAIVYTFTLKPDIAINSNNETIKIAPYDQSYYIDVALKKRSLKFENTEGYSYSYRIIVDEQMAYYFDQIFPDCIVLTVKKAHADHL